MSAYRQSQDRLASTSSSQGGTLNRNQVPERRGANFIAARGRLDSNDSYFDEGTTGRRSPAGLKRIAKSQDRLNSTSSSLGSSRGNLAQQKLNVSVGNISQGYNYNQPPGGGGRHGSTASSQQPPSPQQPYQPQYQSQRPQQQQQQQPYQQQQHQQYQQQHSPQQHPPYSPPHSQQYSPPSSQHYQPQDPQGQSPNYSNIPPTYSNTPNVSTNNNNYDKRSHPASNRESFTNNRDSSSFANNRESFTSNRDRESRVSTSSVHSQSSIRTNKVLGSPPVDDKNFQDFEKIRQEHIRNGKLFEDTAFAPVDSSLYYSRHPPYSFDWRRARDIARMYSKGPLFISNGIDRFDVRQGSLGDCWFVAAMSCLATPEHRTLFARVVPPGQSYDSGWYAGIFRFLFWHFGTWEQVIVDDDLPTIDGRLAFVHSSQPDEFWASLMEKAYAKLYGSYESLKSGVMADSLTDLTGGLVESYYIHGPQANLPNNIVNILFKALERQSLIGCGISDKGSSEKVLPNGLIEAHAYSVTDLRRILNGQQPVTLIRVRNPYGQGKEWRGRWSEWSEEFQQIAPMDRERLGLVRRDDGEFWMDFEDFLDNFDTLDICNLTPDSPVEVQKKWHTVEHHGRWIKGYNAGGRVSLSSHWANPQYHLRLEDTDEDEDNVCSVLIQLMQKDRRKLKQKGEKFNYIGFSIYPYDRKTPMPLKKDFFDYTRSVETSGAFINARQITCRITLSPGEYVLVPCTYDADQEADYYLRFFFEKGNVAEFCDEKPEKTDIALPTPAPEWKEQEEAFKNFFYRVSGEDMDLNAFELRDAINDALRRDPNHKDISLDTCRSFVNLMDVDGTGRLSFFEFQFLWHHLRSWRRVFNQCDINNTGTLEAREVRIAINNVGYEVSHQTMVDITFRYADPYGRISLDDFLALMARLMKAYKLFNDLQKDGTASLSLEKWLESTLVL